MRLRGADISPSGVVEWGRDRVFVSLEHPDVRSLEMTQLLRRLVVEESGQDIIEYALLAAGIAILLIPVVPQIGQALQTVYGNINTQVGSLVP